ncbi:MAG: helix-turn-helix domain-containing protein [Halobacteria archaeon]
MPTKEDKDTEEAEDTEDSDSRVRIIKNEEILQKNETIDTAREQVEDVVGSVRNEAKEKVDTATGDAKNTLDEKVQQGVESFDKGLIDLLSGFLDTETRAKAYLYLRKRGEATSEEIAEDTGLYPSTVRETLSDLYQEGVVERRKKQTGGAGNNPYIYTAVPPSDLAKRFSDRVEDRLNTLFNLDSYLGSEKSKTRELASELDPYEIVIKSEDEE